MFWKPWSLFQVLDQQRAPHRATHAVLQKNHKLQIFHLPTAFDHHNGKHCNLQKYLPYFWLVDDVWWPYENCWRFLISVNGLLPLTLQTILSHYLMRSAESCFTIWSRLYVQKCHWLYLCPIHFISHCIITISTYCSYHALRSTASKSVIWASFRLSALHSRLWFCSFAFTKPICNWHKVSYCSNAVQSAANTHSPLPGLYRPVTSDLTEKSTNAPFPLVHTLSSFSEMADMLSYLVLCLFCIFFTFPEWQSK